MKLTKTEIRKKVEAICKKKDAYFMGPANFRDFLKDLKEETNQLMQKVNTEQNMQKRVIDTLKLFHLNLEVKQA